MLTVPGFNEENLYLVMQTRLGVIKRTSLDNFKNLKNRGIIAIGLNEGDELGWVRLTDGKQTLFIGTKYGKLLYIDENDVRNMGRTATGVRAIKLKDENDCVVGMDVKDDNKLVLTIAENGKGKLMEGGKLFSSHHRGTAGQTNFKTDKNGYVVCVQSVSTEIKSALCTH